MDRTESRSAATEQDNPSRAGADDAALALPSRFGAHLGRRSDLIPPGSTVLVALSGGPDSIALLHLLLAVAQARRLRVVAAHFDHGVRPGSAAEAETVASWTAAAGAACRVGRPETTLDRTQQAFRTARYAFLHRVARDEGAHRIATAHHADDQAETVLHRLLRGTGLRGLAGIPARRGRIVRPLLPFRRSELRAFLDERGLPFLEDPSNRDPRWLRSRIRHEILPTLERSSGEDVVGHLTALARRARRVDRELDAAARRALGGPLRAVWEMEDGRVEASPSAAPGPSTASDARDGEGVARVRLSLPSLRDTDRALQARVVRLIARRLGARPRRGGTRSAIEFIKRGRSGGGIDLAAGLRVWREFDHLWVGRPRAGRPDEVLAIPAASTGSGRVRVGGRPYRVEWGVASEREPGAGGREAARWAAELPVAALRFPLRLRGPRPGDRIRLARGGRKLKRLFNEQRVPRSERPRVPVLYQEEEGELLWVGGVGVAEPVGSPGDEERFFIEISDA